MENYDITLNCFKNHSKLIKASVEFFEQLNIYVTPVTENIAVPVLELMESQNIQNKTLTELFGDGGKCKETFFVGTLNDLSLYQSEDHGQATLEAEMQKNTPPQPDDLYTSLMIFAVEAETPLTKSDISLVCRSFNRAFAEGNPVVVMFRQGDHLTFSLCERTPYLRTTFKGQKAGKVSMLRNISIQNPHSGHLRILYKIKQYKEKSKDKILNFNDLYLYWLNEVFAVNVLTDDFYREILNWYLWATGTFNTDDTDNNKAVVPEMKFPDVDYSIYTDNTEEGRLEVKKQCTHVIRLITRLIFVWFIKQKGLIDESLFSTDFLKDSIRGFADDDTNGKNYYPAILQNLFFASLNCKSGDRGWAATGNSGYTSDYGNDVKYKDDSKQSFYLGGYKMQIENLFKQIPYLNGGLFDCLDYVYDPLDNPLHKIKNAYKGKKIYVDGFSQEENRRAQIPDRFFFGYTDNDHKGIIDYIFNRYYFTIEENSTNIIDVALDPELLGHVFEELLSVYNPETGVTMRKATGSFYTPKEIVEYMVTQSVAQYLSSKFEDIDTADFLSLIEDEEITEPIDRRREDIVKAVIECKIFDPACGSGAFPMGCLHVLNSIVSLLDDNENTFWKRIVIEQTKLAHQQQAQKFERTFNEKEFMETEKEITENFTRNIKFPDYLRKLYILEHCIYGSDIQRIAMQITKLRFFISLVVEQRDNSKIQTLPNLETKFACANTLIDNPDPTKNTSNNLEDEFNKQFKQLISTLAGDLKAHRSKIFNTPDRKKKLELKKQDRDLRNKIADETKKIIDNYRNSEIAKCKQKIAEAQKAIDDLLAQPDDTRTETFVEYNIFGEKEEKKKKTSKRKTEIDNYTRIKADWERKLQKYIDGGTFKAYQSYAERLCEWNPYDMSADNCSFFDAEWMFGVKDGFDVVIGNPPYIQLQNNGGFLAQEYEKCGFEVFAKTGDIYCLFYERAYQLLYKGGICCFITSNKWMRAAYGEKLREYFVNNTNPILLIDFAGVKIFNSATVDTNILLSEKSANRYHTDCCITKTNTGEGIKNLSLYVKDNTAQCEFCSGDSWVILSPIEQSIKRKIEAVGTPLKDWDIQINYGIKTGFNDAFIITTEKRDEILNACQTEEERKKTAEIIRPILRGRDIKRYGYDWADLWLINTHNGVKGKYPRIDIKDYPAIKAHLDSFGTKVTNRSDQGDTPYNLRNCAYMDDFDKPKIVWGNLNLKASFALVTVNSFINAPSTMIVPASNYLLGVLNSKLADFYIRNLGVTRNGGYFEYKPMFVEQVPIPQKINQKFVDLVDKRLRTNDINIDNQIDALVYEMYGLNEEEIKVVDQK